MNKIKVVAQDDIGIQIADFIFVLCRKDDIDIELERVILIKQRIAKTAGKRMTAD